MEVMNMTTRETVEKILNEIKPTIRLVNMDHIIDDGYLDSLELMTLISALMNEFGFELDIEWITPENFNSVDAIVALVERLKG